MLITSNKSLGNDESRVSARRLLGMVACLLVVFLAGCSNGAGTDGPGKPGEESADTAQETSIIKDTKAHKITADESKAIMNMGPAEKSKLLEQMIGPQNRNMGQQGSTAGQSASSNYDANK
jgi:hypothetical protein